MTIGDPKFAFDSIRHPHHDCGSPMNARTLRRLAVLAALFVAAWFIARVIRARNVETAPPLTVAAGRAEAVYQLGEPVVFLIQAVPEAGLAPHAEVVWTISKDGAPPIQSGRVAFVDGAATVTAKLDEPGFLLCEATVADLKKSVPALAGAGVEPGKIAPSLPVPEDFAAFWAAQKQRLAAIPLKSKLTSANPGERKVTAFDVQVEALGAPVSGYLARPLDAHPKSLPVILLLHSAGVFGANLSAAALWAEKGFLAMDINAHGLPNGQRDGFYRDLGARALKDYPLAGREARESSYFLGMFLRLVRAIDFLCAQPEWDGRSVIVHGASQGGFQALAAAALDERVTFFAAGVPAGCDHSGMVAGRITGWPRLVPMHAGQPDANILQTARYFDAVNFARLTKAKGAIVTVGFIDKLCPPTTVYTAFNALPIADKKIYQDVPSGHDLSPGATAAIHEAIFAHLQSQSGAGR